MSWKSDRTPGRGTANQIMAPDCERKGREEGREGWESDEREIIKNVGGNMRMMEEVLIEK